MTTPSEPRAARFLELALLFTIACHAAAMLSMVLLLLPGLPGGGPGPADRVAYIAGHPWLWRFGWFPWQLTALSDLLLAVALLRTPWVPRIPAVISLAATLAAISFEQPAEFRWITTGVELARQADRTGIISDYLTFEQETFRNTSLWAATFYTIAAVAWSWALAVAGAWNRWLTWLSVGAWGVLMLVALGPLLELPLSPAVIAAGNAVGFVLMMLWFVLVTELVLRRSRPDAAHGRMLPWRSPYRGPVGGLLNAIANSRTLRALGEFAPTPVFVSDITEVIYVNYLVPAERLESLLPPYLELQRLGPGGRWALFTHLTYNHGHFGPRLLGPLRRLLPSPVQSNWRIHVRDPQTGTLGIYFVSTAIANPLNALAARLLSEGVPMHVPRAAEVTRTADGVIRLRLDPGPGSAPDIDAELRPGPAPALTPPWSECFADFRALLAYCVPQDRAMSAQPWKRRVTRQEIRLDIPLDACEPLTGAVRSQAAAAIVGDAQPLCFRVAAVAFRYDSEVYDYRTP